eukprot:3655114-Pyramimonas_sp.AAC.1
MGTMRIITYAPFATVSVEVRASRAMRACAVCNVDAFRASHSVNMGSYGSAHFFCLAGALPSSCAPGREG